MKKVRFFDLFCIFTALMLLFTVGFHIGFKEDDDALWEAIISIRIEKSKLSDISDEVMIDGRYDCEIISLDDGILTLRCEGKYSEAGFLASGAKYLSENQPLEIIGGANYFFGRIASIDKERALG